MLFAPLVAKVTQRVQPESKNAYTFSKAFFKDMSQYGSGPESLSIHSLNRNGVFMNSVTNYLVGGTIPATYC